MAYNPNFDYAEDKPTIKGRNTNTWSNRHKGVVEGKAGDTISRKQGQRAYWNRYASWRTRFENKRGKVQESKVNLWFAQRLASQYPHWPISEKHQVLLDREAERLAKEAEGR
tara:strand:- start:33827 stop:34162 length:336 start_codon:yes stop_codon:yes gene_type:complete